jgi:hypothetical protein
MDGSKIYDITLGLGHNNDSGMAIITGLKEGLLAAEVKVIGDGGYGSTYAVTPTNKDDHHWHAEHAAWRSVVERVNSRTASFAASCINTGKFRGPPELQVMALMCIYHLVQHGLDAAPLYANRSGPARWHWSHEDLGTTDASDSDSYCGGSDSSSRTDFSDDDNDMMSEDDNNVVDKEDNELLAPCW